MKIRTYMLSAVILALCVSTTVHAKNTLVDATDEVCQDIKAFLDAEGKNKVRIGQFIGKGPEALRSSAQPLLREAMKLSLQKKKIEIVEAGAHFELSGSFKVIEDNGMPPRQAILLSVEAEDPSGNGRKFQGLANGKAQKYFFENVPDVAKVLGLNTYLPPGGNKADEAAKIKEAVDHPQCALDGTKILAAKGAPFAIEILVAPETKGKRKASDYKVKTPKDDKGLAFVPIARGEAYGVRLYNLSKDDIAVDLRLDGLNMYFFSEKRDAKGGPIYRYVIVPANRFVEIRGWFVTLNDSEEFLVVPREKSAIAEAGIGSPAEIGTITANFHRAWDRKAGRPSDEPANPDGNALSADATGRGQKFEEKYVEVDYAVGSFRGSVSARYTK